MPRKFDFVSPGILMNEVDESQIPPVVSDSLGPLIIGRALSGPAMKPIKVKSIDAFNEIFGKGISGKGGSDNDVWREGNTLGATYGIYAAQAHLASQTTPVTFVRLLGEANPSADSNAEYAGWSVSTSANPNELPASTNTAYGLFIIPSASFADADNVGSGSLAAVFYTQGAALALSGTVASGSATTASAGTLINSMAGAANRFKMCLYTSDAKMATDSGAAAAEEFTFDLTPGSKEYIRDVFNTNPQILGKANKNFGLTNKKYFLGESYEVAVAGNTATTAGSQVGILLALDSGSLNYADHFKDMKPAKSGWFINRQPSQENLFRVVALHDGEWLQNNYEINIRDLSLGNTLVPNSTFTLEIVSKDGNVVEQYSGLNLDPSSENYISKVIGDQYLEWDSTNTKYNVRGEYGNNSDYIYVEVASAVKNQQLNDRHALPVGFYGPLRPKGFTLSYGSKGVNNTLEEYDTTVDGDKATATITYTVGAMAASDRLDFIHPDLGAHRINFASGGTTATVFTAKVAAIDRDTVTTANTTAAAVATLLNTLPGYTAQATLGVVTITAITAGSHFTFSFANEVDAGTRQLPSAVTPGTDTDDFAHSFVKRKQCIGLYGWRCRAICSLTTKLHWFSNVPSSSFDIRKRKLKWEELCTNRPTRCKTP